MVLVTGATGMIGANLARLLVREGYRVRVLVRAHSDRRALDGLDVDVVDGDLRDPDSLWRALSGCQLLFHVAGLYRYWARDPRLFYAVNTEGSRCLLSLALRAGVERVVYTSTMGTIGPAENGCPATEETPFRLWATRDHYTRSKYLAQRAALTLVRDRLPLVVVNPGGPLGPWDVRPTPLGRLVLDFVARRIPFVPPGGFNVIDVEDVAVGHLAAARHGRIGERYLLTHANLSFAEFFDLLARVTGIAPPRRRAPYGLLLAAGAAAGLVSRWVTRREPPLSATAVRLMAQNLHYSSEKARRELGLPQSSLEGALEREMRWFRDHGYLP